MVAHTCTRAQNVSVPTYLYLIHAVDGFIQNFFAMDKIRIARSLERSGHISPWLFQDLVKFCSKFVPFLGPS